MGSSNKNSARGHLSDIKAVQGRGVKKLLSWIKNRGTTVNLKPTFYKKHPAFLIFTLLLVGGVAFLGVRQLFTRAEVADFYPSSCLGTWQNPSNAQGVPETLGATTSSFTNGNSAIFSVSSSQIFCGGFTPLDFKPTGNIKRVGITFIWNVSGGSVAPSASSSVNDASSETTSSTSITTASSTTQFSPDAPVSGPSSASSTLPKTNFSSTTSFFSKYNFALPDFLQPTLTAFAEDTSTALLTNATTTAANDTTAASTTVETASHSENFSTTSSITIILGPPLTADLFPLATMTTTAASASTTEATNTVSSIPPASPSPDENFLEISYSTDGANWIALAKINQANWKDFTISLPIANWDDLKKLQVKVAGMPTSLTELPSVLLDGMFVEAQYEIPPVPIGAGGGSSPLAPSAQTSPAGGASDANQPVIILPPQNSPLPVGGDANFKSDESPIFDLDLNGLPAPVSPELQRGEPTSTASTSITTSSVPLPSNMHIVTSTSPAASTSSPAGFLRGTSNALFLALDFFLKLLPRGNSARAQTTALPDTGLPTAENPAVAQIFDLENHATNLQPTFVFAGSKLRVILPKPGRDFVPGAYSLKLWVWRNGAIYYSESTFSWGVLAVNFNKSIYAPGDAVDIGFAVLTDRGHTVCDAAIDADIVSPSGKSFHFNTTNNSISRSPTCGPNTVTNQPDYSTAFSPNEVGTYNVSVTAVTENSKKAIADSFEVQNPPLFDVERLAPTRIYPPATYQVTLKVKANADFAGQVTETVPNSWSIATEDFGARSFNGDSQTLSWQVNMKKGDEQDFAYYFNAPNVSPKLYKLGPLQIGAWQESRQWQIAADATVTKFYLHDATSSDTGTLPGATTLSAATANVTAAGASTTRAMDGTIGILQTSSTLTSLGQTSLQRHWYRRFLSPPLAAQILPTGIWTLQLGAQESAAAANESFCNSPVIKVWRPSTGAVVATVVDSATAAPATTASACEAGGGTGGSTEANISTTTASIAGVAVNNGDILVLEVWAHAVQGNTTARTDTMDYDGTTEGSATTNAAFLNAPGAITLSSQLSVSNVVLNAGGAIILNPNATTTISAVASTTAGANPILYATSTIYRSGAGATCAANNLNCYQLASSSCSFSGATTTVTCSAGIYYFAQATDASSSFSAQNWLSAITITDSAGATNSSTTASGVKLNTLLAINVTTSSVDYGTLTASSTSGSVNQVATTTNAGNSSTTLNISGTALTSGSNSITTSSQHYATSSFTFGGIEQVLSAAAAAVSGFLLTAPTSTNAVSSPIFWGITVPAGNATGTYSGTNTFTAIFSP